MYQSSSPAVHVGGRGARACGSARVQIRYEGEAGAVGAARCVCAAAPAWEGASSVPPVWGLSNQPSTRAGGRRQREVVGQAARAGNVRPVHQRCPTGACGVRPSNCSVHSDTPSNQLPEGVVHTTGVQGSTKSQCSGGVILPVHNPPSTVRVLSLCSQTLNTRLTPNQGTRTWW